MAAQYTIGLDYGTNSVRALIVNVANGAEIAAAVWNYAHGTQGVILSRDPNLARQHPADYRQRRGNHHQAGARHGEENGQRFQRRSSHRHRRGHDGQHADARGRQRPAAGVPEEIRQQSRRDGVAVEGPHRRRRSRRDHRAGEENAPAISRQMRRHLFERMVLGARFCTACAPRRRFSTPRIRGSSLPTSFPPRSPARSIRTNSPPAFAPPATRRCGTPSGAVIPTRNFFPGSIRSSAQLRARLTPRVHTIDRAVGGLTAAWAKKTGLTGGHSRGRRRV